MIDPQKVVKILKKEGCNFFIGVPDSTIKGLINSLIKDKEINHMIATNEGEAVAIATGYYLSTGNIPVVYLQNDGLGNAINPLTSLIDEYVYNIPMLFLIGWRGFPEKKDAIQHKRIGAILAELLKLLNIEYEIFNIDNFTFQIKRIMDYIKNNKRSFAILFQKGDIKEVPIESLAKLPLTREKAIEILIKRLPQDSVYISTTGKTSRELYEIRLKYKQSIDKDFYLLGSMGYASAVGLGISLNTKKQVVILDGDGALLMHMGNLVTIGSLKPSNFLHVLLNNQCHESAGKQPLISQDIDFASIARSCGYERVFKVDNGKDLENILDLISKSNSLSFLEIKVNSNSRNDLKRVNVDLENHKINFMEKLAKK